MTESFEHFNNDLCEKLFDFIYPDESSMSDKEVGAELRRLGIDVRPAWDKIQMALDRSKQAERARKELESARRKRPSNLAKLKGLQIPSIPNIREEMHKWVEERFAGPDKAAYCRRLEGVSDKDLKTLIEDLSLLEEFSKDSNNVET
jgi:hypothetical protein